MCLGIPARIVTKKEAEAQVDIDGIRRTVNISLTPEAKEGDYILLHAGYAIEIIDTNDARERLELLRQLLNQNES